MGNRAAVQPYSREAGCGSTLALESAISMTCTDVPPGQRLQWCRSKPDRPRPPPPCVRLFKSARPPCCIAASTGTACVVWHAARPRDVKRHLPRASEAPKSCAWSDSKPTPAKSYGITQSIDVRFRRLCDAAQGEDDSAQEAKWLADLRKTVEACGARIIAQSSGARFVTTAHWSS